jgi:hypothetical protein
MNGLSTRKTVCVNTTVALIEVTIRLGWWHVCDTRAQLPRCRVTPIPTAKLIRMGSHAQTSQVRMRKEQATPRWLLGSEHSVIS